MRLVLIVVTCKQEGRGKSLAVVTLWYNIAERLLQIKLELYPGGVNKGARIDTACVLHLYNIFMQYMTLCLPIFNLDLNEIILTMKSYW